MVGWEGRYVHIPDFKSSVMTYSSSCKRAPELSYLYDDGACVFNAALPRTYKDFSFPHVVLQYRQGKAREVEVRGLFRPGKEVAGHM